MTPVQPGADLTRLKDAQRIIEDLLSWADRYRNADPTLHPEEYYIARDEGRRWLDGLTDDPDAAGSGEASR